MLTSLLIPLFVAFQGNEGGGGGTRGGAPLLFYQPDDARFNIFRVRPFSYGLETGGGTPPMRDWNFWLDDPHANPTFERPNRTFAMGYNMRPDGNREALDEVAFGHRWETCFEVEGERWLEHHIAANLPSGRTVRPMGIIIATDASGRELLALTTAFQSSTFLMADMDGAVRWSWVGNTMNAHRDSFIWGENNDGFLRQRTRNGSFAHLMRLTDRDEIQIGDFAYGGERVKGVRLFVGNQYKLGLLEDGAGSTAIEIGVSPEDKVGFHGATPIAQQPPVDVPCCGGAIDLGARSAIQSILERLENVGIIGAGGEPVHVPPDLADQYNELRQRQLAVDAEWRALRETIRQREPLANQASATRAP